MKEGIKFRLGERTLYFNELEVERFKTLGFEIAKNINSCGIRSSIGTSEAFYQVAQEIAKKEGFVLDEGGFILDYKPRGKLSLGGGDGLIEESSCANYERDNITNTIGDSEKEWKVYNTKEVVHHPYTDTAYWESKEKDPIVEAVREKLLERSKVGIKKYNTTIWDNTDENYVKHLQDELLDGANYCEQKLRLGKFIAKVSTILDRESNYYIIGELIVKEYNKLKYGI